jgi:hypothetical protein
VEPLRHATTRPPSPGRSPPMTETVNPVIGLIGGSGLYDIPAAKTASGARSTPLGRPVGPDPVRPHRTTPVASSPATAAATPPRRPSSTTAPTSTR